MPLPRVVQAATRALARRGPSQAAPNAALEAGLVWLFSSPRSGSTWLLNLLRTNPRVVGIDEPGIGAHLGLFAHAITGLQADDYDVDQMLFHQANVARPDYFFSKRYEAAWRPSLRELILSRIDAQVRDHGSLPDPLVVLKEPNGAQVADVLLSLMPTARLIFLVRDGRDVLDSWLDSLEPGGWATQYGRGAVVGEQDRLRFLVGRAHEWVCRIEAVQRACRAVPAENHMIVRYEDLLSDSVGGLSALLRWLGLESSDEEVRSAVDKLDFAALPENVRGRGQFARAATPGLWRQNLSEHEREVIEGVMGERLRDLGYEVGHTGRSG